MKPSCYARRSLRLFSNGFAFEAKKCVDERHPDPAPPGRPPARRGAHVRGPHDHAGDRGRSGAHHFRLQRRGDPADLRRDLPLQRGGQACRPRPDPAHRARQRAGGRLHGRRLRPRERGGGRVRGHLRTRRDQHCYTRARLHGRFDTHCRNLRPGLPCCHGHRCLPGGARAFHHGRGRQAHLSRHRPGEARGDRAHGLRDRPHRTPRSGGSRHPQGRAELGRHLRRGGAAADPRLPAAHARADPGGARARRHGALLRHARGGRAAADLRRRRRHQRQRRRGAHRVRQRLQHPGGHDPHGDRRLRHHADGGAAHARHARGGVCQLCGR